MKNLMLLGLICLSLSAIGQTTVKERSGKKPNWTMEMEQGHIVGIGKAMDMQQAQDNALLEVKAQIVSSIADNIVATSELKTTEITTDKISAQLQTYTGSIKSESAIQDFLVGVSKVNVRDFYWEKLQDKKSKTIYYQYFIKYPFDQWDLRKLVDAFKLRDQELTDALENTLDKLNTFKSIEELRECKATLKGLSEYFIDQRKTKAEIGIEKAVQLLSSVIIRNEGSSLGNLRYALYIDNRIITFSARPTIKAPCAIVEDRLTGTEICELKYRYDECYGDIDNTIKISYNIPEGKKAEQIFYFDINEN